jgi:hypothetical protein
MEVPDPTWPLSAAATAVLRDPKLAGIDVLKLALKELVLRRVWGLRRGPRRRLRGQRSDFVLGTADVPPLPPLVSADRALRSVMGTDGREVREAARLLLKAHRKLPDQLRDEARAELASRGLVELERRKVLGVVPQTKVVVTESGRLWAQDADARTSALSRSIGRPPPEVLAQAGALGGLVLLLDPAPLAELDQLVKRTHDDGTGTTGYVDGTSGDEGLDLDLGGLDLGALDGLDSSFDAAVDSGSSDGGGDGGGGDGGG